MKNGDTPARPIDRNVISPALGTKMPEGYLLGLTKREYFAAMCMQGLVSKVNGSYLFKDMAQDALRTADALLDELGEGKNNG